MFLRLEWLASRQSCDNCQFDHEPSVRCGRNKECAAFLRELKGDLTNVNFVG
jgi:hypothetical protein